MQGEKGVPSIQESCEYNEEMIQINLSHCEAAQDLPPQPICEKAIEMAITSELYRNNNHGAWSKDVIGKTIQEVIEFPGVGFVKAKIAGICIHI